VSSKRAASFGALLVLLFASTLAAGDENPGSVFRLNEGAVVRELRVWQQGPWQIRFELTGQSEAATPPTRLSGQAERPNPGDCLDPANDSAACNSESDSEASGEGYEVYEYMGDADGCSLRIRIESDAGQRATVHVVGCPQAARLDSRSIYRKVE
jgi:hypothetical protein